MMRYIRYGIYAIIIILFLAISLSNTQPVNATLTPEWFPFIGGLSVTLPFFIFVYVALFMGIALGYLIEYIREARIRRRGNRSQRELKKAQEEIKTLKKKTRQHDDDVLAILE